MNDFLLFRRFLQCPDRIGAIYPSGPKLCRAILNPLKLKEAKFVVELGPGTGAITKEILARIGEDTHFFAVELDRKLYKNLHREMPDLKLYNANADTLHALCREQHALDGVDIIISALPWASYSDLEQHQQLNAIEHSLKEGGAFVTFAYVSGLFLPSARRFRHLLRQRFGRIRISPVIWKNMPPAIIYRCVKKNNIS